MWRRGHQHHPGGVDQPRGFDQKPPILHRQNSADGSLILDAEGMLADYLGLHYRLASLEQQHMLESRLFGLDCSRETGEGSSDDDKIQVDHRTLLSLARVNPGQVADLLDPELRHSFGRGDRLDSLLAGQFQNSKGCFEQAVNAMHCPNLGIPA